jgi:hypothetical protein
MNRIQSVQPGGQKTLLPAIDGGRSRSQPQFDGLVLGASGQQQDQPGAKHISGRQRPRLGNSVKFQTLVFGEQYGVVGHTRLGAFI